jgi:hypothetical protein
MPEREYDIGQGVKLPDGTMAFVAGKETIKQTVGKVVRYWVVAADGSRPGDGKLVYAGSQISPVPIRRKRFRDLSVTQTELPGVDRGPHA